MTNEKAKTGKNIMSKLKVTKILKYTAISFTCFMGGQGVQLVYSHSNIENKVLEKIAFSSTENSEQVNQYRECVYGKKELTVDQCATKTAEGENINKLIKQETSYLKAAWPLNLL
ncbi:hypothetical protein [Psychromonas sp. KJ10-2]|uniref:hypothetical protein n=1 Tax=Psychromonas sp. KJ10-2 TaxID=3391822 RepID=UPI0039B562BE